LTPRCIGDIIAANALVAARHTMQHSRPRLAALITLTAYLLSISGCSSFRQVDKETRTPDEFRALAAEESHKLAEASPFLKVHMHGGNLYVLSTWEAQPAGNVVTGTGALYGPMRNQIASGDFTVGIDSVALFETNVVSTSPVAGVFMVAAVLTVAVSIYCIANPKSCFGSCPTFYIAGDPLLPVPRLFGEHRASLEASDIDDLGLAAKGGDCVDRMRNGL
jgi:hypothetical protein